MKRIFNQLKKSGYKIFGPRFQDNELHILELEKIPEEKNMRLVPERPFKYYLMPEREILYEFEDGKPHQLMPKKLKRALFGMNLFDLKALELYDRVFKNDTYYQNNRKDLLIVGYSPIPAKNHQTIFFTIDDKILENIIFDIFVESSLSSRTSPKGEMRDPLFFVQSDKGEKILKACGLKYKRINYNPRKEDKRVMEIKKAVENTWDSKLWDELGKICLACGKCTISCPTCFCFDLESKIGPKKQTERCSGNCFYDDFTRIAGGHKFLNNPKEKIKFWYEHKFVRIPHEYGLPGCVGCGRCTAVCPVEIDIEKNIRRLLKENNRRVKHPQEKSNN